MKISYAITVCNEFEEIQKLIPFLLENKREEDEIVVSYDVKNGDINVEEYLRNASSEGEFTLKHNDVDVLKVPRINTVEGLTQEHVDKWNWNVNNQGWVNFPDFQWRVYKNDNKIKWKNPVHEVLDGYQTISYLPTNEEWCLRHDKVIEKQEQQNKLYEGL